MSNYQSASTGGIGFVGALFLLFLGLKLAGFINWSWWLVFAPLWAPVAIALAICTVWVVANLIVWSVDKIAFNKRSK